MKISVSNKGLTFVDVLVGISLMLIIFLGVFGAYQLGFKVIAKSRNKITATAIANQQIEKIRNLPYESIGVQGGFPEGVLQEVSTITRNNIEYTINARVDYVVDSADGIASPDDDCPNDYKKVEIRVSWPNPFGGEINLGTDIAPKDLIQECAVGGGILSISVFDAYGLMVPFPLIEIRDPMTDEILKTAIPTEGKHYFSLPSSAYKVVVSKTGYSSERTYGVEEVATPEKPNPLVIEGELTEISFSIDRLSAFSVETFSPWGQAVFSDSFLDETKISQSSDVTIGNGEVNLLKIDDQYQGSGYIISTTVVPSSLINWDEFSFSDYEITGTQILYQILYFDGESWILISDSDLPGNSLGFSASPVDLSSLNPTDYSQLRLKGTLSTTDPNFSPTLYDWEVLWRNSEATPIPNVTFNLRGNKIIGTDEEEKPVYKYSQDHVSNSSGHKDISELEWDVYTFSISPATGLDLVSIDPSPQPISLAPNTDLPVYLYLQAENSLLITIQNIETLEPIFSATVRLYNTGLGYDTTQYTDEKGQTYFIPLEAATYNLEVSAPGYTATSASVWVSSDVTKTIKLEQIE